MGKRNVFGKHFLFICVALLASSWSGSSFAASGITYQGRLLAPDGSPVTSSAVQFRMQIRTPGAEDCLLYEEIQTHDLSTTSGMFAISLNDGSGVRQDTHHTWTLFEALANRKDFTFTAGDCTGINSYSPAAADNRKFRVFFNDGSFAGWEALPIQTINYIPMSIESYAVGGFPASSLLRIEDAGTLGSATPLTSAQYTEILALVNGNSSQYEKDGELNGSALPTIGSGESVRWNGSAWQAFTPLTSETDPTVEAFAKSSLPTCGAGEVLKSDGTSLSCVTDAGGWTATDATATVKGIVNVPTAGGLEVSSGSIGLPDVVTAGTYTKVTVDDKGRVTSGANITGDDITSGEIDGTTSINTSGNIATSGAVSSGSMSTRQLDLYDSDNSNFIRFLTPATTDLTADYTLRFPTALGTSNQVLGMNAAGTALENKTITAGTGVTINHTAGGIEIEATGSGGTVTSVTGTAPISVDNTDPSDPVISLSNTGTAGTYGSSTEVPVFTTDAKGRVTGVTETTISGVSPVGSSLTSGQAWIGNGSNEAQARFMGFADLKTSIAGNASQIPTTCTASQTMTYSAVTDVFSCTNISIIASQVSDLSTELDDYVEVAGDTMTGTLNLPSNGLVVGTDELVVSGGNVGIGTANPESLLDLRNSTKANQLHLSGTNDDQGAYFVAAADGGAYISSNSMFDGTSWTAKNTTTSLLGLTGGEVRFYNTTGLTAGNTFTHLRTVTIDSGGRLGVGTGTGAIPDRLTVDVGSLSNSTEGLTIKNNSTGSYGAALTFEHEIGTTGTFGEVSRINSESSPAGSFMRFYTHNGTSLNQAMMIDEAGNLGIGTNPSVKLDVFGAIQISNNGETCSVSADGGMIRYNGGNLQFCNGSSWQTLGVSGAGLTSLNGQTGSTQTFATPGTSGTAPNWSSASDAHTLNIPMASTASVTAGLISKTDYDNFNSKLSAVAGSSLSSGQAWIGNGSNVAASRYIGVGDLKTTLGAQQIPSACTSAQTMVWSAITDVFSCTDIAIAAAQVSDLDTTYFKQGGNSFAATAVLGTNDAQSLQFETNNSPALTILSDGKVGVGTDSPNGVLEIQTPNATPNLLFSRSGYSKSFMQRVSNNGSKDVLLISESSSDTNGIVIDEVGLVGIGTSDPKSSLHVWDGRIFQTTPTDTEHSIALRNDVTGRDWQIYHLSSTDPTTPHGLMFEHFDGSAWVRRFSIDGDGKVAIGPTAPTVALDLGAKTDAIRLPAGTTAQQPSTPANGMIRYNSDNDKFEAYQNGSWINMIGGASSSTSSVSATDGSVGSPSISFANDSNTGLYSSGADSIGISAGGSQVWNITTSSIVSPTTGGASMSSANGTAAAPTFSFAGDTDTGWFRPAANTLAAATGGTERIRIDANGNVAIGQGSSNHRLTVQTTGAADGIYIGAGATNGGEISAQDNSHFDVTNGRTSTATISMPNYGMAFPTTPTSAETWISGHGGVSLFTSSAERLRVRSDGNVGIGIANPLAKLSVKGGATFNVEDGGTHGQVLVSSSGSVAGQGGLLLTQYTNYSSTTEGFKFYTTGTGTIGSGRLRLGTVVNNAPDTVTDVMTITSSGNVGIGTTDPSGKLTVAQTVSGIDSRFAVGGHGPAIATHYEGTSGEPRVTMQKSRGTASAPTVVQTGDELGNILWRGHDGNSNPISVGIGAMIEGTVSDEVIPGKLLFNTTNDSGSYATRMTIEPSGNVGIGTTDPATALHVHSSNEAIRLTSNTNGGAASTYIEFREANETSRGYIGDASASDSYMYVNGQSGLSLQASGTTRLHIATSGHVGVGTTSPQAKLEVAGGAVIGTGRGAKTIGVVSYYTVTNSTTTYIHIKTPFRPAVNNGMYHFKVEGHSYSDSKDIDLTFVGYSYTSSPTTIISPGSRDPHGIYAPTQYIGSDGYIYLRFKPSNTYYTTIRVDSTYVGNGRIVYPGEMSVIESTSANL